MTSIYPLIFAIILISLLDFGLTAAKTGFTNARYPRLLSLGERTNRQVEHTLDLVNHKPRSGSSLHISHVILRFVIAGLTIATFSTWQQPNLSIITVSIALILTALILSFTEHIIEIYVLRDPEMWALRLTSFTRILLTALAPILAIPLLISRRLYPDTAKFYRVTEDELNILLDASQQEGVLEKHERRMINSILRFSDTFAREIMVPRIDILALNVKMPISDAVDAMLESGFSRVPVYEETIDKTLGILYVKDLLHHSRDGKYGGTLQNKIRPAYFIPETKKVDELLTEMQNRRIHIALVVDEYGGVAGLVTLEDIVEELIGEIQDEYDQAEEKVYEQVGDGEFIFQGSIDLDDFNEIMNSGLPREEADTLGGLIYSRIGSVPKGGETLRIDDILLTVEQVVGRRIRKVRAQNIPLVTENKNNYSARAG